MGRLTKSPVSQMSSSSSNSSGPTDASEPRSPQSRASKRLAPQDSDSSLDSDSPQDSASTQNLEAEAVKTFAFEVGAGHPARAEEADSPLPVVPKPKSAALPPQVDADVAETPAGETVQPSVPVAIELAKQAAAAPQIALSALTLRPPLRVRQRSAWWIASFGVHVLLLLFLAFSTLVVLREEEQLELYVSPAVHETLEEFEDLEIDTAEELESLEEDYSNELEEPDSATLAELTSASLLEEPPLSDSVLGESASADVASSLGDVGQLFGDSLSGQGGNGMSEVGSGMGGSMARFFGTEIKARRILYMLDNSGGMRKGGKFESLVSELQASVSALEAKQQFYVIFYSDTVYPLFYPNSVRKFVSATDRNRQELGRWLDSVELCGGNAIDEALAAAEIIRPDAIFLLTDGDLFTTEKKKALLLNPVGRRYQIHTFGLGVGAQTKTATGLKQVAAAHGGTFRAIKISSEMKALAKEKERPYHNKKPGAVWGLKVGTR